ncbi:50S ribosomal protein L25/general stress protein Ctc [Corynebacterium felinum]|uniref:Large ribosomal subunit protein bL25 n=1 Tax=Corynebacterium felinum TaxID=131318 RepID=A0ABU2B9S0_9CORY|nr:MULTISPECIES: 50S ribosomal protein L25/general stress protein Ctc [Corynebacterium]MDF5821040.1 50S ribosomal protein L25/general stress protein Ctc [Corynebacterium felinum]MDO4760983.1 50S ribosomal protein L25/general stress protein Ctc [Corynebacterium sp.]MDR7355131.1 large subunit ribosomal protein L25 [Corynebacterium felinum]WJY94482.1 General stress protein CTC [Corynebacterium felinum]
MSAENIIIAAAPRNEFGKGAARRLRRDVRVPGVVYGLELETPIHFHADLLEIHALLRRHGSNAVFELDLEGEKHLVMVKHVDQNVITLNADHIDLLAIKRGEKVEVEVPVVLEGETAPGTQLVQDLDVILVEADVLSIPEEIKHSVEGLEADSKVLAGDIVLPAKTTLVADAEAVVATVSIIESNEEEAEASESEAEESAE